MDRRQIASTLTLRQLGLQPVEQPFNNRLIVQKALYLAQAAGIGLGYHFRWYLRGPYSPEVADDLFAVTAELATGIDEADGWTLDSESGEILTDLAGLIPQDDTSESKKARWLELLASVHFLVHRRQVAEQDPALLQNILKRYKKDYSLDEIRDALTELRNHGLLPS
ncbi:MAG: hypothetical protein JXQ75_22395 [Phycisphaerae bacterium]|nr:hypothetical protein [Phycisphaerae bacterium]